MNNDVTESSTPSKALHKVCRDYWDWRLREFPQFATYRGVHDYNDRLDEYTITAFTRRKASL